MRRKKPAKNRPRAKPLSAHEAGKFTSRVQETPDAAQPVTASGSPHRIDLYTALTDRQLQVLGLMAEPMRNRDISTRLELEVATIEKHIEHIFLNLEVQTRGDAIACFLRRKNEECQADRVRLVREKRQLFLENEKLREENERLTLENASLRGRHD